MRLILAALAGFALAVVPALAADHEVTAGNYAFTPKDVTIAPGDSVTWSQGEGNHTVHFDGEPAGTPLTTPYERTFETAGTYGYYCDPHGGEDGAGMSGSVIVKAPETTGTTTTATTTTESAPPPTTTQTVSAPEPPPPPVVSVKATRSSFCVRRSRRCRRPGVVLRISSDTAHRIQGTLRRGARSVGTVAFDVPAGTRTVRFTRTRAGRRLARGRYSLRLGTAPTVRFRVR